MENDQIFGILFNPMEMSHTTSFHELPLFQEVEENIRKGSNSNSNNGRSIRPIIGWQDQKSGKNKKRFRRGEDNFYYPSLDSYNVFNVKPYYCRGGQMDPFRMRLDQQRHAFKGIRPVSYTHLDVYKRQTFNYYIICTLKEKK